MVCAASCHQHYRVPRCNTLLWHRKVCVQHQTWRQQSLSSKCRMCTSMTNLARKRMRMPRRSTALRIIMTSGHEQGTSKSECPTVVAFLSTCKEVLDTIIATNTLTNG